MALVVAAEDSVGGELTNKVLAVFQSFDANADGCIDRYELKEVMSALNPTLWNDRRLSRLLHTLDKNRDGRLQYQEFIQWACGDDETPELVAFRESLAVGRVEALAAPPELPAKARRPCGVVAGRADRSNRSGSRARTRNANEAGQGVDEGSRNRRMHPAAPKAQASRSRVGSRSRPVVRRRATPTREESAKLAEVEAPEGSNVALAQTVSLPVAAVEAEATCLLRSQSEREPGPADTSAEPTPDAPGDDRLIIFDYDGTITVDKDERFKGLMGRRLTRLKEMMGRIRASTARCILVTAQFPSTTRDITLPSLEKSGLSGLFEDESLDARLRLYWDDAAHGTVYNGAKVMLGKIDLIKNIIVGENCWRQQFCPSNVLFIDDDARNFKGNENLGIQIRHVEQDGMAEEDIGVVEAFAERRGEES